MHVLQWPLVDTDAELAALPFPFLEADLGSVPGADLDEGQCRTGWEPRGPEEGLHRLEEALRPGDVLLVRVAAGGWARLQVPEGSYEVTLAHPSWLLLRHPLAARVAAALQGTDGAVHVTVTQAAGTAHLERRPLPQASLTPASDGEREASPAPAPGAPPSTTDRPKGATPWCGFGEALKDREAMADDWHADSTEASRAAATLAAPLALGD